MLFPMRAFTLASTALLTLAVHADESPLEAWKSKVSIHPVTPSEARHSIHSYFNTSPESPDGRHVLCFTSTTPEGHFGEVRIIERATGKERVLAEGIRTEDAHRVACQQWVSKGRRVVFHNEHEGQWSVQCVDVESGETKVLAKDRLSSWGQQQHDLVPIYGPHWNPGPHRDLELVNATTGEIKTVLTADAVKAKYPAVINKAFGDRPFSIFFPVLSPDLNRVFFKLASSTGGDPRSKAASARLGLVCYSLVDQRFLYQRDQWGHPSWHPDSKTIVEVANLRFNSDNGSYTKVQGIPVCRGDHPSVSPDGRLVVTDTTLDKFGGKDSEWGIVLGDARGGDHVILHRFDNSKGARSWRRSHPHPAWSADSKRLYFNVSDTQWTRLYVAEVP